jgi:glycosyltransferase (activator-dependent family)
MRVLFVANPEKAHILPMTPMAWALRTAGHDVRFAVQPAFVDLVTQSGLTAVPVGRDADLWKLIPRHPLLRDWTWEPEYGLPKPYDVAEAPERITWDHLVSGYAEVLDSWHKPACFPMIAELVTFARAFRPDLVVWEPLAYAGPIAARACGAAHARLPWGNDVFGATRRHFLRLRAEQPAGDRADPLGDWLAGYARRYGGEFAEDMMTGHFTLHQLPPSLRVDTGLHEVSVRYVPYGGPAVVPKWLSSPPVRPRVALTMGLSLTDHNAGYTVGVQEVFDHLADLDVEVVATLPDEERDKLARIPGNARIVPYVPLHALAPTCAVLISHGGYGTVLTMAGHGIPQLVTPWDFDAPLLGDRAAAQGAALSIRADEATGPAVREAVLRLLHEERFIEQAAALREEIEAMPAPGQVVPHIEQLIDKYRPER